MIMKNEPITIDELITVLRDGNAILSPHYLYRFSDMPDQEIEKLTQAWESIPEWRRKALMEDLEDLGEKDDLLSFEAVARLALRDHHPLTRLSAVRALWEFDSRDLVQIFINIIQHDPDDTVRAAAAHGLGRFVYAGEVGEIPETILNSIVTFLVEIVQGQDATLVRRNALVSLGYSERSEIPGLIKKAYESGEKEWIASALVAMGHSADSQWSAIIISSLESPHPIIRSEAARASGELAIKKAVPRLLEMLDDPDNYAREAAIWALSQTGGSGVRLKLERLLIKADDEEAEYIQEALELLAFTEETSFFPLIDISEIDEDPFDEE